MASITPDNVTVNFNLNGTVILDIDTYNELHARASMYDEMLTSCLESFKVVDKEPSTWSTSTCRVDGQFKIPAGIFDAVVDSIVSELLGNDSWVQSLAEAGEHWLDLKEGRLATYTPSNGYSCDLLDVPQFAERFYEIQTDPINISPKTKSAEIITSDGITLGEVILYNNGSACVFNDDSGLQQWFDDPSTGHMDALRYIFTRICEEACFTISIFEAADIAEVRRGLGLA